MRYLVLLLLVGCIHTMSMTETASRTGYFLAADCYYFAAGAKNIGIPYDEIKRKLFNDTLYYPGPNDSTAYHILAYADTSVKNRTVAIAKPYRHDPRLWGHEYLHVFIPGLTNQDSLFIKCALR